MHSECDKPQLSVEICTNHALEYNIFNLQNVWNIKQENIKNIGGSKEHKTTSYNIIQIQTQFETQSQT